jgi:hypothetical protein
MTPRLLSSFSDPARGWNRASYFLAKGRIQRDATEADALVTGRSTKCKAMDRDPH